MAAAGVLAVSVGVQAESRPIDVEHSTLTVFVYKAGLFSAFADNHVIRAPIAAGSVSIDGDLSAELMVHAAALTVVDPSLPADKRAEVAARMHSAEVLDTVRYPEIRFSSTDIRPDGVDGWQVTGILTLHGVSRSVRAAVRSRDGHYRGQVSIRQRDFGIQPISIAGGTVKVKDEIRIDFDIVAPGVLGLHEKNVWSALDDGRARCAGAEVHRRRHGHTIVDAKCSSTKEASSARER